MKIIDNKEELKKPKERQLNRSTLNPVEAAEAQKEVVTRTQEFRLVSVWRLFFARFLDLIVSSILPLALSFTVASWGRGAVWATVLTLVVAFIWFFLYFVIVPYLWSGRTLMKWVFQVRMVTTRKQITFLMILTREIFIIFIPWCTELITNFVLLLIFKTNLSDLANARVDNQAATIVLKIVTTFYFLWYIGLLCALIFDRKNQFFVDRRLNLYLVSNKPFVREKKVKKEKQLITRNQQHIHLKDNQPGNITEEALKEIEDL